MAGKLLRNGHAGAVIARDCATVEAIKDVVIAASSYSSSLWLDVEGYATIGITFLKDAATAGSVDIYWSHNGIDIHGFEAVIPSGTTQYMAAGLTPKAKYMRITVVNGAAAAHMMNAWAYLVS